MKYFLLITLASLCILVSCGRKEYTENGILEIKKEIDSLLYNPEAEEHFNWGSSAAYSNFRAYFHKSKLIFINEDYRYREPGESFNRYYFKDGKMIYFVGRELTFLSGKKYKNVELMVDPDGNVIAYDYVINGQRTGLDSEDSKKIIKHSQELERIVSERSKISRK
jgi:hypothetical protein